MQTHTYTGPSYTHKHTLTPRTHPDTRTPSYVYTHMYTHTHTHSHVQMHVSYTNTLTRTHAHTCIQFRGFLQRVKFAVQLSKHCAQKHHHQLMVDYGQRVTSDRENALLKTFQRKDYTASTESEH